MLRAVAVTRDALDAGAGFTEAMTAGYSAVLCSPGVVFLEERPGELDAHALAPRQRAYAWVSTVVMLDKI